MARLEVTQHFSSQRRPRSIAEPLSARNRRWLADKELCAETNLGALKSIENLNLRVYKVATENCVISRKSHLQAFKARSTVSPVIKSTVPANLSTLSNLSKEEPRVPPLPTVTLPDLSKITISKPKPQPTRPPLSITGKPQTNLKTISIDEFLNKSTGNKQKMPGVFAARQIGGLFASAAPSFRPQQAFPNWYQPCVGGFQQQFPVTSDSMRSSPSSSMFESDNEPLSPLPERKHPVVNLYVTFKNLNSHNRKKRFLSVNFLLDLMLDYCINLSFFRTLPIWTISTESKHSERAPLAASCW